MVELEWEVDVKFKPGDVFTHESGIYLITDVKPGYGQFDAILFADLTERESD